MSNYDISTALYGAKDDSLNATSASEVEDVGEFSMVEHVQSNHKFKLSVFQPNDPKNFIKFVRLEVKLLRSSLPTGTTVNFILVGYFKYIAETPKIKLKSFCLMSLKWKMKNITQRSNSI